MNARMPLWLRQLGWPGLVGAALLLGWAWFVQVELPRQRESLAQTESDVRRLRHGLIARESGAAERPPAQRLDEAQAWSRLWSALPEESQRTAAQARVFALASEVGVPLQSVQWQGEAVKWGGASGLWRQRMVMPLQAPYPALRTWLDRLQRVPGLSIDALDIQRNDVQADTVQAQVSLSLWWRQAQREAR